MPKVPRITSVRRRALDTAKKTLSDVGLTFKMAAESRNVLDDDSEADDEPMNGSQLDDDVFRMTVNAYVRGGEHGGGRKTKVFTVRRTDTAKLHMTVMFIGLFLYRWLFEALAKEKPDTSFTSEEKSAPDGGESRLLEESSFERKAYADTGILRRFLHACVTGRDILKENKPTSDDDSNAGRVAVQTFAAAEIAYSAMIEHQHGSTRQEVGWLKGLLNVYFKTVKALVPTKLIKLLVRLSLLSKPEDNKVVDEHGVPLDEIVLPTSFNADELSSGGHMVDLLGDGNQVECKLGVGTDNIDWPNGATSEHGTLLLWYAWPRAHIEEDLGLLDVPCTVKNMTDGELFGSDDDEAKDCAEALLPAEEIEIRTLHKFAVGQVKDIINWLAVSPQRRPLLPQTSRIKAVDDELCIESDKAEKFGSERFGTYHGNGDHLQAFNVFLSDCAQVNQSKTSVVEDMTDKFNTFAQPLSVDDINKIHSTLERGRPNYYDTPRDAKWRLLNELMEFCADGKPLDQLRHRQAAVRAQGMESDEDGDENMEELAPNVEGHRGPFHMLFELLKSTGPFLMWIVCGGRDGKGISFPYRNTEGKRDWIWRCRKDPRDAWTERPQYARGVVAVFTVAAAWQTWLRHIENEQNPTTFSEWLSNKKVTPKDVVSQMHLRAVANCAIFPLLMYFTLENIVGMMHMSQHGCYFGDHDLYRHSHKLCIYMWSAFHCTYYLPAAILQQINWRRMSGLRMLFEKYVIFGARTVNGYFVVRDLCVESCVGLMRRAQGGKRWCQSFFNSSRKTAANLGLFSRASARLMNVFRRAGGGGSDDPVAEDFVRIDTKQAGLAFQLGMDWAWRHNVAGPGPPVADSGKHDYEEAVYIIIDGVGTFPEPPEHIRERALANLGFRRRAAPQKGCFCRQKLCGVCRTKHPGPTPGSFRKRACGRRVEAGEAVELSSGKKLNPAVFDWEIVHEKARRAAQVAVDANGQLDLDEEADMKRGIEKEPVLMADVVAQREKLRLRAVSTNEVELEALITIPEIVAELRWFWDEYDDYNYSDDYEYDDTVHELIKSSFDPALDANSAEQLQNELLRNINKKKPRLVEALVAVRARIQEAFGGDNEQLHSPALNLPPGPMLTNWPTMTTTRLDGSTHTFNVCKQALFDTAGQLYNFGEAP